MRAGSRPQVPILMTLKVRERMKIIIERLDWAAKLHSLEIKL